MWHCEWDVLLLVYVFLVFLCLLPELTFFFSLSGGGGGEERGKEPFGKFNHLTMKSDWNLIAPYNIIP